MAVAVVVLVEMVVVVVEGRMEWSGGWIKWTDENNYVHYELAATCSRMYKISQECGTLSRNTTKYRCGSLHTKNKTKAAAVA